MEEVARGLLHWIASGNRPGTVVVSGQSHRWVLEKLERIAKRWPDEYPDLAAAVTKAKDANTKRNRLVHDALHPDVDTGKAVAVRDKDGRREQRPHLASEADQAKAAGAQRGTAGLAASGPLGALAGLAIEPPDPRLEPLDHQTAHELKALRAEVEKALAAKP